MKRDTTYLTLLTVFQEAWAQKLAKADNPLKDLNFPQQHFEAGSPTAKLRAALINEEARELIEALTEGTAEDVLKEICDLIYVTVGTAAVFYEMRNLEPAFNRVHDNNMLKVTTGTVRPDGKLVKPVDHPKVRLGDLL